MLILLQLILETGIDGYSQENHSAIYISLIGNLSVFQRYLVGNGDAFFIGDKVPSTNQCGFYLF
jgi:hypothetical protein